MAEVCAFLERIGCHADMMCFGTATCCETGWINDDGQAMAPPLTEEMEGPRQRVHFRCESCGEWSTIWTYTPDLTLYDLKRAHCCLPA